MWNQKRQLVGAVMLTSVGVIGASCGGASVKPREYESHRHEVPTRAPVVPSSELFEGQEVLVWQVLVQAALERNPTIEVARQGWRFALAKRSQADSFEDPMLSYMFAPLSIASDAVDYGHVIEVSQALPYPGKRGLRAQVASAEAESARQDYRTIRLKVSLMAASLYYELYVLDRSIAIYSEYERELGAHREALTAYIAAGRAWQEDALKIDVDLGEVTQIQIDLHSERDVVAMQINALLHRRPSEQLPPPPPSLALPAEVDASSEALQELALRERPEMSAAQVREDLGASRVALADRDFYPDFRVMGQYDNMWPMLEHQIMVGVSVNLPVWRANRKGAVQEAEAERDMARAGLEVMEDKIRSEVDRAYRAQQAARDVVHKYQSDIVPPAEYRAQAVRSGLDTGRTSFIEVWRADHDLLLLRLRYEKALANAHERTVELALATGSIQNLSNEGAAQ